MASNRKIRQADDSLSLKERPQADFESKPQPTASGGKPTNSRPRKRRRDKKPFTNAILKLLRKEPKRAGIAAAAMMEKAEEGDLRVFLALREIVEGKAAKQPAVSASERHERFENIGAIDDRILEILRRSPELLARLDPMGKPA